MTLKTIFSVVYTWFDVHVGSLGAGLHHGLHEVRPWKMACFRGPTLMVQLPWSDFLTNQVTKPLGPSLGVNRMWTQRNDMHEKVNVVIFLIYTQKRKFCKNFKLGRSLVFSCLHLLFPKKKPSEIYYKSVSLSWALAFFYYSTSRWTMSMNNVGLKICLLETLNSIITLIFFPWCKPKWSLDKFNDQSQILLNLGTTS